MKNHRSLFGMYLFAESKRCVRWFYKSPQCEETIKRISESKVVFLQNIVDFPTFSTEKKYKRVFQTIIETRSATFGFIEYHIAVSYDKNIGGKKVLAIAHIKIESSLIGEQGYSTLYVTNGAQDRKTTLVCHSSQNGDNLKRINRLSKHKYMYASSPNRSNMLLMIAHAKLNFLKILLNYVFCEGEAVEKDKSEDGTTYIDYNRKYARFQLEDFDRMSLSPVLPSNQKEDELKHQYDEYQ